MYRILAVLVLVTGLALFGAYAVAQVQVHLQTRLAQVNKAVNP